LTKNI